MLVVFGETYTTVNVVVSALTTYQGARVPLELSADKWGHRVSAHLPAER